VHLAIKQKFTIEKNHINYNWFKELVQKAFWMIRISTFVSHHKTSLMNHRHEPSQRDRLEPQVPCPWEQYNTVSEDGEGPSPKVFLRMFGSLSVIETSLNNLNTYTLVKSLGFITCFTYFCILYCQGPERFPVYDPMRDEPII